MKSIRSTVQPPVKPPINDWYKYIYKATENTVRKGGIAYQDLEPLEQVKKQLRLK